VLVFATTPLTADAAAPNRVDPAKSETANEKLRKALDQNITVEFQGHTLPVALEALREQTKVNLLLDRVSAMQMGVEPEQLVVNLKLTNVKFRTVLKNVLSQFNLTFVIEQDVLLVTTEHVAVERQVRQRVNVDFDKTPLDQALRQLSRETGVNLVIDPRHVSKIKDTVTLKLEDVPLEVAVRLVSEIAGLRSVRQSNVLFVTSKEVAAELRREENIVDPGSANPFVESLRFLGGGGGPGGLAVPNAPPVVVPANPAPAAPASDKPADKPPDQEKSAEKDK
jgi:type II secretory pathway component HofQ